MALSAFNDKSSPPRSAELRETLGRSSNLWDRLRDHLASDYQPLTEKWSMYSERWGWSLQLKKKKRTILYMTPCKKHFLVGFVLGEKAVKAAHESELPEALLALIDSAPKYPEGRGVRIEVRTKKDLEAIKQLAAVKMAN
ncbi:MAG: DUF3788 domain-containing protein [Gemmatimonadales bacterium]|jgi:hypothetical protein